MPVTTDFPHTRWSLIARIGGASGELATLVELYAPAIARYLAAKLPEYRASGRLDDVVQETLIALLQNPALLSRAKPGEGSRFRYLVMTTAYLLARNALRRLSRPGHHEISHSHMIDQADFSEAMTTTFDDGSAIVEMDRSWAAGVISSAWDDFRAWCSDGTLDGATSELLHAHLVMGLSVRAVAERYGLSLAQCHRTLVKGRTYLQRAIVERLRRAHEADAHLDPAAAYELLSAALATSPSR